MERQRKGIKEIFHTVKLFEIIPKLPKIRYLRTGSSSYITINAFKDIMVCE